MVTLALLLALTSPVIAQTGGEAVVRLNGLPVVAAGPTADSRVVRIGDALIGTVTPADANDQLTSVDALARRSDLVATRSAVRRQVVEALRTSGVPLPDPGARHVRLERIGDA